MMKKIGSAPRGLVERQPTKLLNGRLGEYYQLLCSWQFWDSFNLVGALVGCRFGQYGTIPYLPIHANCAMSTVRALYPFVN